MIYMYSENNNKSVSGGVSFPALLTILFITLKLCGVIAWSWWWVLSPIPIAVVIIIGLLSIVAGLVAVIDAKNDKKVGDDQ